MKKILMLILIFGVSNSVSAMTSENYKINADDFGLGGNLGTSENYNLTDTIGEPIVGVGTSENYKSKAGFWYMVDSSISLSVDSATADLGNLTPGTPNEAQSTLTVTTDSWGGYDLYVEQNSSLTHTDTSTTIGDYSCSIVSPCLWTGIGLGFTIKSGTGVDSKWGTDPDFKYAAFPLSATIFHEKLDYASGGDETIVGYKVDASSSQKSGSYSNIITFTASAKL